MMWSCWFGGGTALLHTILVPSGDQVGVPSGRVFVGQPRLVPEPSAFITQISKVGVVPP